MCSDDENRQSGAVAPAIFGFIFVLSGVAGTLWCTTFKIEANDDRFRDFEFGIFTVQNWYIDERAVGEQVVVNSNCVDYGQVDRDAAWKTAGVLQPISWGVSIVLSIILLCTCCGLAIPPVGYKLIGACFILICSLFTGMIYYAFKSELCRDNPVLNGLMIDEFYANECSISSASGFIIFATIGYFFTGVNACFLGFAPTADDSEPDDSPAPVAVAKAEEAEETSNAAEEEAPPEESNVTKAEDESDAKPTPAES